MDTTPSLLAALLLGLFGSTHCVGMCGGISSALAFALPRDTGTLRRHVLLVLYSTGRICSYALMGAMVAGLLGGVSGFHPAGLAWLRIASGVLLILMGLNLLGIGSALSFLERAASGPWNRIQKAASRLLPIDQSGKALLAGAAWGWLPCGLVYSTLAWSATSASPARGALLMLVFGIGTMPAVVASGALAAQLRALLQRRESRLLAGLCVAAFGLWTIAAVLLPGGHAHHH